MQRTKKDGFFLIEWMVHFFILIILMMVTSVLILSWQKNSSQLNRLSVQLLPIYIATDLIRMTIHNAQKVSIKENALHVLHDHTSITWRIMQGKLMKIVSSYDAKQNMWLKPMASLIATDISDMTSDQYDSSKGTARAFECTFKDENNEIRLVAVGRNGAII